MSKLNLTLSGSTVTGNIDGGESFDIFTVEDGLVKDSISGITFELATDGDTNYLNITPSNKSGNIEIANNGGIKKYFDLGLKVTFSDGTTQLVTFDDGIIPDSYVRNNFPDAVAVSIRGIATIENAQGMRMSGLKSFFMDSAVTSCGEWEFFDCTTLTSVTFSDNITYLGAHVLHGCSGLKQLHLPANLQKAGDGFAQQCTSMTALTLPNALTFIDTYAFEGWTGISELTIPSGVTMICNNAFENCSKLAYIAYEGSNIEVQSDAFKNVASTGTLYMTAEMAEIFRANNSNLENWTQIEPAG